MSSADYWDPNSIGDRRIGRQGRVKPYSEVQLFFLLRLERLLRVRREHAALSTSNDWWAKLLSKAIYSTYCDCIELGVGEDARSLLSRDQAIAQS
ncbi:MAG TPA: hypothetical protein VHS06_05950 [Chloroflexota bacterium]|nr:hypothetical protein [Chloroflexota bacterium]HEX2987698.1 hypothetical protein [Chloroflexota bacterium]